MSHLAKVTFRKVLEQPLQKHENWQFLDCRFPPAVIVLEAVDHVFVGGLDDPPLGYHRSLGIPSCVSHCLVSTPQRGTDENVPAHLAYVAQELWHIQPAPPVTLQPSAIHGILRMGFVDSSDDPKLPFRCQKRRRNQVALRTRDPFRFVERKPAARDDDVQVGVPLEVAAKGMQNGDEAGAKRFPLPTPGPALGPSLATGLASPFRDASEPFLALASQRPRGPECQAQQGVPGSPEQDVEPDVPIVVEQKPELPRDCEDKVAIWDIQKVGKELVAPRVRPGLSATRARHRFAAVRNDQHLPAAMAQEKMRPELRSPAGQHRGDVEHDRGSDLLPLVLRPDPELMPVGTYDLPELSRFATPEHPEWYRRLPKCPGTSAELVGDDATESQEPEPCIRTIHATATPLRPQAVGTQCL